MLGTYGPMSLYFGCCENSWIWPSQHSLDFAMRSMLPMISTALSATKCTLGFVPHYRSQHALCFTCRSLLCTGVSYVGSSSFVIYIDLFMHALIAKP